MPGERAGEQAGEQPGGPADAAAGAGHRVYLVVTATITDPARMAAYADALARSGLYQRHGGRYVTIGRAIADLEAWDGRAIVVAEFPSRAAAEAFWHDPVYQQEVKPLREGAGEFHVALFAAAS